MVFGRAQSPVQRDGGPIGFGDLQHITDRAVPPRPVRGGGQHGPGQSAAAELRINRQSAEVQQFADHRPAHHTDQPAGRPGQTEHHALARGQHMPLRRGGLGRADGQRPPVLGWLRRRAHAFGQVTGQGGQRTGHD
jgi:hypothetical protein